MRDEPPCLYRMGAHFPPTRRSPSVESVVGDAEEVRELTRLGGGAVGW